MLPEVRPSEPDMFSVVSALLFRGRPASQSVSRCLDHFDGITWNIASSVCDFTVAVLSSSRLVANQDARAKLPACLMSQHRRLTRTDAVAAGIRDIALARITMLP